MVNAAGLVQFLFRLDETPAIFKTLKNKNMNNIENTRLIAEFMGYEVIDYQHNKFNPIYNGNKDAKTVGQLRELWGGLDVQFTGRFVNAVSYPFTEDWNYLMPVITKIEQSGYVVKVAGISCQIYKLLEADNPIVSLVCGDLSKKREVVYNTVINFLKHINNKK